MAQPSNKKAPSEPLTFSKIFEVLQTKGYLKELWLDLISDIKEKQTYQQIQAVINEVISNTMATLTTKSVDEKDEKLKENGLTEISIMTYTLDAVISEILYRRYKNEFRDVIKNLIKDVIKSKAAEASNSAKNNSVFENIQGVFDKKNSKSTDNKENDRAVTDANKSQIASTSKAGEEIKAAPTRKRGRPSKAIVEERKAGNGTAVPESKKISLPMTPEINIVHFDDEIKYEVPDEESDAESDISVGNMSLDSVSSVHTSELSSFEDNISICSDDEEEEKKYVPLKVANEMYLQGKLSQIYQFGKNSERLKRMKDAAASVSKDLTKASISNDLTKANISNDLTKANISNDLTRASISKDLTKASVSKDLTKASISKDLTKARNSKDLTKARNSKDLTKSSCGNDSFSARKILPQRVRKPNPKYNSETMLCDFKDYSLPHADTGSSSSQDEMEDKSVGVRKVQRKRKRSSLDKETISNPPKISSARNIFLSNKGRMNKPPISKPSTKWYDIADLYKPRQATGGIGSRNTADTSFSP